MACALLAAACGLSVVGSMSGVARHLRDAPLVDMTAISDGYFPYVGTYPGTTADRIYGRQLEVHHLVDFAAVGDRQSKAWLELIERDPNASI